jgi:catalase
MAKRRESSSKTASNSIRTDVLPEGIEIRDPVSAVHASAGQSVAEPRRHNADKPLEYCPPSEVSSAEGEHTDVKKSDGAGTLSEKNINDKTSGNAIREDGGEAPVGTIARDRSFAGAVPLTTNQGTPLSDNQSSLKAGVRGPTLLEDFILREKLTHFDHERIPERVVHARGSAAHGYFECDVDLGDVTKASVFIEGKRTPVFVRFSTVAGERGSADTARDVRGFAVKFYTDQGNWDLVGNNIPVFFIQDAMKFPDLVHAVRPEPHNGIPQAASAHDTFWDFVSLMPESTHMLCWVMSDRAIPRSLRMMQGFGVHTFRLVNADGVSTFVKFHWIPKAGVHSLVWDEAVRISGADPDFHRRDLWEAIEGGAYPEWELGLQLFSEEQADQWSFDVLDPTKLVPEELCPVRRVGRLVLDRNPDNFFAETEQVAFCTAHVVPGIDFSNDPLLAGRHHSYLDTQLSRLGGPNFHEIPINAPLARVANNQRDGIHRATVHRGKVAYEPNSLGGGCPFQAGLKGYVSFPAAIEEDHKFRGKPEKFGEHYNQARLFYSSLTQVEQGHMEAAFRFELSKVAVPAIRSRMVASLRHVDDDMATRLADHLGIELPEPLPLAIDEPPKPEIAKSENLSQTAFPGDGSIKTRKVAVLLAEGVNTKGLTVVTQALAKEGAVIKYIAPRLGEINADGDAVPVDATYENSPSVLFDAIIVPGDMESLSVIGELGHAVEYLKHQYRHCKTIGLLSGEASNLAVFGIPIDDSDAESASGIVNIGKDATDFIAALSKHRHPSREADPPRV